MHPHRKVPGRISAQGELQQGDRAGDLCEAAAAGDTEHMAQLVGVGMGIDQGDYDKRSAPCTANHTRNSVRPAPDHPCCAPVAAALHLSASEGKLEAVQFIVASTSGRVST
jgi:hypothetical protein